MVTEISDIKLIENRFLFDGKKPDEFSLYTPLILLGEERALIVPDKIDENVMPALESLFNDNDGIKKGGVDITKEKLI